MRRDHGHLPRLDQIQVSQPIFFVTTCTSDRAAILADPTIHDICREVWQNTERYGWHVGRYVLMPDHVHYFCAPFSDEYRLDKFVGKWKEWTAKYVHRRCGRLPPLWQTEFFDRLLRTSESYEEKWEYVRDNPVRAGLVADAGDWPYQGELHRLSWD